MKHQRKTEKKVMKYLLIVGIALVFFVVFLTPVVHLPISWSNALVGIKAEPEYLPFEYENSYMTSSSCGKRCDKLKLHYVASNAELVVLATDYVSWYDDPKWNKKTKIKGSKYYYREKSYKQYLYWREDKEELELSIEYTGENKLPKSEIVKIADSIKADGKLIN